MEILFFRFVTGLLALFAVCPKRLEGTNRTQELTFAAAGLCGICLYYLLENIALTYTMVSVVTSAAILRERITVLAAAGTFLTLAGLFLSESKLFLRKEAEQK